MEPESADLRRNSGGTAAFFLLAWVTTWTLAAPMALAWARHETPRPYALGLAGLSAFGPLLSAFALSAPRKQLREVFGRWRANPAWVLLSLFAPLVIHVAATALYVLVGGHPARWLHPPGRPEELAALIVFPIGEELGWRGFAYPRMARHFGLVRGTLLLGAGWGLWHLMYGFTPSGAFDFRAFGLGMVELPLYSLLMAWVLERTNRSLAVAIAFHAGAHLDHFEQVPAAELGLHGLHVVVLAILAFVAARSLAARETRPGREGAPPLDATTPLPDSRH